MPKYSFAFLSGGAVIFQTLLPLIAPAEQATWLRWRICGIVCGAVALFALAIQLYLQYREERELKLEQEKREQERDKKMNEILRRLPKRRRVHDAVGAVPPQQEETLVDRVEALAHDLYECLKEGMEPGAYVGRFRQRLLNLLGELGNADVQANIPLDEIEPPRDRFRDGVRRIADNLVVTAVNLAVRNSARIRNGFLVEE